MGTTTFTGPIKAGDVLNTTGTAVGSIKNVGQVIMAQTSALTQATNDGSAGRYKTSIVIPKNSQIVRIDVFVNAAWSGVAQTINVGTSTTATELAVAADNTLSTTLGLKNIVPGDNATRTNNWIDVGTSDVQIYVLSTNTGTGTGYITIHYLQAINNVA